MMRLSIQSSTLILPKSVDECAFSQLCQLRPVILVIFLKCPVHLSDRTKPADYMHADWSNTYPTRGRAVGGFMVVAVASSVASAFVVSMAIVVAVPMRWVAVWITVVPMNMSFGCRRSVSGMVSSSLFIAIVIAVRKEMLMKHCYHGWLLLFYTASWPQSETTKNTHNCLKSFKNNLYTCTYIKQVTETWIYALENLF